MNLYIYILNDLDFSVISVKSKLLKKYTEYKNTCISCPERHRTIYPIHNNNYVFNSCNSLITLIGCNIIECMTPE